ncbi:MAG TPA: PD-(D/E)XK nuclease family protein, partial [Acidobacteriota bacterium]|nr:PD-(D/E)XK nuclease family protein [Acidobacteriota bacterium]
TATRARDRLILLSPCRTGFKQHPSNELNNKCLQGLTEDWVDLQLWHPQKSPTFVPRPAPEALNRELYQQIWKERQLRLQQWGSPLLRRPTSGDLPHTETYDLPAGQSSSLVTGRLVHSYLERWVREESFSEEKFQFLWQEVVDSGEIPDSRAISRAKRVLQRFYAGELRDSEGISYCERVRRARIAGRELPVFLIVDGRRWNGILDLVLEEEGRITAIDYKSSARLEPLPDSYQQQAMIYRRALEQLFPRRNVGFEFWWLGQEIASRQPDQQILPFAPNL